jgi:hypothetical protein
MKGTLTPVGLIDLLDFVRLRQSDTPEPSTLIVSFDVLAAARRFTSPVHYLLSLREAQSIQVARARERVSRHVHHSHRPLATHLTKASTLDAGAGSHYSRSISTQVQL